MQDGFLTIQVSFLCLNYAYSELLKGNPVTIKTSADFQTETLLFTFNYLVDIFIENVDLS